MGITAAKARAATGALGGAAAHSRARRRAILLRNFNGISLVPRRVGRRLWRAA